MRPARFALAEYRWQRHACQLVRILRYAAIIHIAEIDIFPCRSIAHRRPEIIDELVSGLSAARERGRPVEWLASVEQHFGHRPLAHQTEALPGQTRAAGGGSRIWHWRDETPVAKLPADKLLPIEDQVPFTLHLGFDGWEGIEDRPAQPGAFGVWFVALTEQELADSDELNFYATLRKRLGESRPPGLPRTEKARSLSAVSGGRERRCRPRVCLLMSRGVKTPGEAAQASCGRRSHRGTGSIRRQVLPCCKSPLHVTRYQTATSQTSGSRVITYQSPRIPLVRSATS